MNPERWKQIDELLSAVLEMDSDKRVAFLSEACGGDEDLRKEVESLLTADEKEHNRIEAYPKQLAADMLAEHRAVLVPGNSIGPYKILSMIGSGGMGEVYRARDSRLGRDVVVKILLEKFSENRDRLQRFVQEARSASALNHPNIITIYDIGSFESGTYIAMEFIEGKTLREILSSGPVSLKKAIHIAAQLADGLARAHEAGIIHRDLKPENVMISKDGFVKILDFGLAKTSLPKTQDASDLPTQIRTDAGFILGTAAYMSPEQASALAVDFRSDQFSFGIIFYEMVTGKNPFYRKTTVDTLSAIINEEAKPVGSFNPELPAHIQWIIDRCMAKNCEDRYGSTRDLAKDIQNIGDRFADGVTLVRKEPLPPGRRRILRKISLLLGIAVLVFGLAVALNIGDLRKHFFGPDLEMVQIRSLAVLPLQNLSGDPNQDYFSDGMTDALISELGKISSLKVISRTSIMQYKKSKKSLPEVARELNVDGIVEGSVLRAGQRVRITAQLIVGRADQRMWGESYEGTLSDVLALQSEVARAIVSQIRVQLTPEEKTRLSIVKQVNPESNEAYLKGLYCFNAGLNNPSYKEYLELLRKSFDYFHQAIKIDPQNAAAYAGLAGAYQFYAGDYQEYYPKSKAAALKALELDDSLAEAHGALGYDLWVYDWDWPGAEREFKRAIQLNPSLGRHGYALYLSASGRHSEAIAEIKKTEELNPMDLSVKLSMGGIYIHAREYDQAIHAMQNLVSLSPKDPHFNARLGYAYYCKGMYQEAVERLKWSIGNADNQLVKDEYSSYLALAYAASGNTFAAMKILNQLKESNHYWKFSWVAAIYAALGEKDEAIEWLEKAFQQRANLHYLKVEPPFDRLHSDPRFQDLCRRIGIP